MADLFPTKQQFYDAEKDLRTVNAVSNSRDPDTGAEIDSWVTRRGDSTDTLAGRLKRIGIERVGDFTAGCTVTTRNQGVLEIGGSVYVWLGVFPTGGKVVPPGSTPASTGGIGPTGWLDIGDASAYTRVLNDLAAAGGVNLVNGAVSEADLAATGGADTVGKSGGGTVQDFIDAVASETGGDQIGYNAGVGGSKRNVLLRLRDSYNIADFKVDTDSDWTNAFGRAAASGEAVSIYRKDTTLSLYSPVEVTAPTTFFCDGGFKQWLVKCHNGPMFNVKSSQVNISDMLMFNDETLGPGGSLILLNTTGSGLEEIRVKNVKQQGGTCQFMLDIGSNLIVDLALEDVKLQAPMANGILLTKAYAYLDMKKVTVNYVPSASKEFTGISISGNEGANLEWCHVNHGITAATANSYGFAFSNCKALWLDRCQADTCGVDGFRFTNCQYVYGNQLSASLCGGDGITMTGSDYTIGNSYFGGRRGLPYAGVAGSALVRSTANRAFLNGCNLSNGNANGFAASGSTVLSGGGIFNTTTPYAISGAAKLRQVMNDAGALIDAG